MSFWSGETLKEKLKPLISGFDEEKIDCAAYTLSIGSEVYITPNHEQPNSSSHTKTQLAPKQSFTVPL